jgi:hypothetical protein
MTATISNLLGQKKYCLENIERIESEIISLTEVHGATTTELCKQKIVFREHCLAAYQTALHQIESKIASLSS